VFTGGNTVIDLLCPTRGRPEQFKRMCDSARETAEYEINILAYMDNDDTGRDKYQEDVFIGKPLSLSPAYQFLFNRSKSDIVMMCADDIMFRTKGWDTKVKQAMPEDLIGVVSFDDLGRPRKEDGHPFIGRKFVELVGYFTYPKLQHSCVDNWVVDIAKAVNRYVYSDIIIEHLHPKYSKGELDTTYAMNNKSIKQADGAIYLGPEGKAEIKKAVERINRYLDDNGSNRRHNQRL
jgi:hypothetical protein